jgi:hypothetical protein
MVNQSASLDATFGALADPTRRTLIATLAARRDFRNGTCPAPSDITARGDEALGRTRARTPGGAA